METSAKFKLLIHSAKQVVQVVSHGETVLCGENIKDQFVVLENQQDSLSIVVDSNGHISSIGLDSSIQSLHKNSKFETVIDASGCCVLPGFIDGHTHPVWSGDRVHEFKLKLGGATYMEIHQQGGGINFTVENTRKSSKDELYDLLKTRLSRMVDCGTTLVECKSGYGLDASTELKMLKVIERARSDSEVAVEISSTFCGAHAIPKGMTSDEATTDVLENQLPAVRKAIESGEITVNNIDVFCEKGVFTCEQSKKILLAGREQLGLRINFHGDELHPTGSAKMGGGIKAEAISHLEEVDEDGMQSMKEGNSVAVILPTTAYILRLKAPPVRRMIKHSIPIALGSDFNPNAFCLSMPMVMHLACVICHMSVEEALAGATINAAASLGLSKTHGSVEVGKNADLVVISAQRWEHVIYQFGGHDHLIKYVIKKGDIVRFSKASSK